MLADGLDVDDPCLGVVFVKDAVLAGMQTVLIPVCQLLVSDGVHVLCEPVDLLADAFSDFRR